MVCDLLERVGGAGSHPLAAVVVEVVDLGGSAGVMTVHLINGASTTLVVKEQVNPHVGETSVV